MGARSVSNFKQGGGGFLNNVVGTITGYEFHGDMYEKNGERVPFKAGKVKGQDGKLKDRFHSLWFDLHVVPENATAEVSKSFFAGDADKFDISEDGLTITPTEEGANIGGSATNRFIASMCDASARPAAYRDNEVFPVDRLDGDDIPYINFEPIVGTRCRFLNEEDAKMKEKGLKRKAKNGKEYNYTNTIVVEVLGLPEDSQPVKAATKGAPTKGKQAAAVATPAKGAKGAAGKPNGKAVTTPQEDIDDDARAALRRYLDANKGSIAAKKLRMQVLTDKTFKGNAELRDAVATKVEDTDWLESGIAYEDGAVSFDKGVVEFVEA
jgi:hypothetical protein